MNEEQLLRVIGRSKGMFDSDLASREGRLRSEIQGSRFLVIGGAGSIGGAVVRELFRYDPAILHIIDISENNLAELVRDIRSSLGYSQGEFHAYCFDPLSREFNAFRRGAEAGAKYDYVLNFSALKHVRSEKDPYTLMRLVDVNIELTRRMLQYASSIGAKKFFCVSTDKAANPVNMMGASKRIMEMFLSVGEGRCPVSTARFANVAFSDGSLPHAWTHRIAKSQPFSAPSDVRRYFVTPREAARLCILSILFGSDGDIFFPKLTADLHLLSMSDFACRYLAHLGYEPLICESEEEARRVAERGAVDRRWPCYFFNSDTTGEKEFEEFYTDREQVDWDRFDDIGVVPNGVTADPKQLRGFVEGIESLKQREQWKKDDILSLFCRLLPNFGHRETGRYLDNRM